MYLFGAKFKRRSLITYTPTSFGKLAPEFQEFCKLEDDPASFWDGFFPKFFRGGTVKLVLSLLPGRLHMMSSS